VIVQGWNAREFTEPFAHVRDTLRFLRPALAARVDGRLRLVQGQPFKLERAPEQPPQIMLAALRPGIAAGGQGADGRSPTGWPDRRAEGAGRVAPTRSWWRGVRLPDRGRGPPGPLDGCDQQLPDRAAYAAFHDWLGRREELAEMHRLWARATARAPTRRSRTVWWTTDRAWQP